MVKFGMGNTLITFTDKYYEYGGEMNAEDRGLMIGGYELAWFADLVVAYIFENTTDLFQDTLYNGIYRDDGIGIFKGQWMKSDIVLWLATFQQRINNLADSNFLKFTAVIWGSERDDETNSAEVTI